MNKRIAILAVMLIVVLYEIIMMLVRKMPNWKEKVFKILSIGSVIIFVGYVLAICVLNLEGHFIQLLTSGRNVAWEAVKEHYGLSVFWLGRGLGDVVNTLGVLQIPSYTTNLHNDLLKVFIESGLLGFVIWVISHFAVCRWISKNKGIQFKQTLFLYLVIIYTMLNYTTDNIMIYINYWFPAYLILLTVISSEEKNETEENRNTKREIRLRLGVILALGVCVLGYLISAYIDYHNPSKITVPEEAIQVNSPDGRSVKVSVWERNGQPYYRIRYGGQNLINPSILGVETSEYTIGKDVVLENTVCYEIFEEEDVKADEDNPLGMPCRQAFIEMHEKDHQVVLEMRVYDSAVAFRYILDAGAQDVRELTRMSFLKWSKIDIHDEKSGLITTQLRENGLKVKSFVLPVKVYNSTGNEMVVSEVTEEGSTISVMSKTNWQKYMVDVEYKEGLNSLEGEVLKTPWRMFEFNQNEALKEEGGW